MSARTHKSSAISASSASKRGSPVGSGSAATSNSSGMTVLASGAEELEDQPHAPALVGGPDLRGQTSEAEQARIGRQRHAEHMARRADDPIENRQARLARAGLVDRDGGLAGTRRPRQLALGQPCRAAACFNDVRRLRRTTPGTRSTIEGSQPSVRGEPQGP